MRYVLTNARPQPVVVELAQGGLEWTWRDTKIVSESQKSQRAAAGEAVWQVRVPANGTTTLNAVFETRY